MAVANSINSGQALASGSNVSHSNVNFATVISTVSLGTTFQAVSTDGTAAANPVVDIFRNSISPAAADVMGQIQLNGRDSAGNKQEYGKIESRIISPTSTTEAGAMDFYTTSAGTSTLQMTLLNTGGQYKGNNANTAPPAGYIGESISAVTAVGSATALTSTITADMNAGIALTAGIWDITFIAGFTGTSQTKTIIGISANSASFTGTSNGDSRADSPLSATAVSDTTLVIPAFRVTLASTTTYYPVAQAIFTGSASVYGRISAVRVG